MRCRWGGGGGGGVVALLIFADFSLTSLKNEIFFQDKIYWQEKG